MVGGSGSVQSAPFDPGMEGAAKLSPKERSVRVPLARAHASNNKGTNYYSFRSSAKFHLQKDIVLIEVLLKAEQKS